LYFADNQMFFDPAHKSRLMRIVCEDGKPVRCEVAVTGFIVSNAVVWRGDTVYVSETALVMPDAPNTGLISGIYAIPKREMDAGTVTLKPYDPVNPDPHLIATFKTSGRVGFGADGLDFDAEGNLYCGIFEDGEIHKTRFLESGKPVTELFAKAPNMASCDGIVYRAADKKIYVADMLLNAVQAVDMQGNVETIHQNGDTDGTGGLLDQPCEVLLRGNELIVINMDMYFESDLLVNTKIDKPYTISAIDLD
jgi:sugar lactone lactonase YvrE